MCSSYFRWYTLLAKFSLVFHILLFCLLTLSKRVYTLQVFHIYTGAAGKLPAFLLLITKTHSMKIRKVNIF